MAVELWKPGFSPHRNSEALRLQGLESCSARGRSVLAVQGHPGLCLSRGGWILACVRCLSPSELLRVPLCALQPLGSLAHSPVGAGVC